LGSRGNVFECPAMYARRLDAILQHGGDVDGFAKVAIDVFAEPLHAIGSDLRASQITESPVRSKLQMAAWRCCEKGPRCFVAWLILPAGIKAPVAGARRQNPAVAAPAAQYRTFARQISAPVGHLKFY
jgi:hypothetical protein